MNTYSKTYEFLLSVIRNVPYGVVAIDKAGDITMVNEQAAAFLSKDEKTESLLGKNITIYTNEFPELTAPLQRFLKKGKQAFEVSELLLDDRFLNITGTPIRNGMLLSFNDITENKNDKDEDTLALLKGQELERRRLAKEIHDGIGPLMSTIRLNLDAVKTELKDVPEKTLGKLDAMSELLQHAATDIRQISHDLMPSALIDFGLPEALNSLVRMMNDSEMLHVNFYHTGVTKRMKQKVEINLYRISQELLNNAIKYAKAKTINIQLVLRDDLLVLTVEDDGVGFDRNLIGHYLESGIGLRNIQTRVASLNGLFSVDTQPGKGVMSTVEIPLNNLNS